MTRASIRVPALSRWLTALALFGFVVPPAASAEGARDGDPVSIGTYRVLRSDVLNEERTLLVTLPDGYEEESASYPVLFVLYGDQVRGYYAEAVHVTDRLSGEGSIPKMIIVGVANVDRYRDLSPVERQGKPTGIEPFSRFVVDELIPFVEGAYRAKEYRVLVGPQAGAEFGFYTIANRPGLFDAFVLENPFRSSSGQEALTTAWEGVVERGLPSPTFVQIAAYDRVGFSDLSARVESLRRFEATIRGKRPRNLEFVVDYVDGSTDFIPPPRLKEGLRRLFREYRFPAGREVSGIADLAAYYREVSGRIGFEVEVPRLTLIAEAGNLKEDGAVDSAAAVLRYMIDVYPASVDGYWQLANLCRERGDRETALAHYRKCLELMPELRPAREWITKLEAE